LGGEGVTIGCSDATVVVLNWRTPAHTIRAVRALMADGVPAERIVVVDNGSGDGSADRIRSELDSVRVEGLESNVGFARANNLGAAALPGKAYVFVNSDAFVHARGSVGRLLAAFDDPEVALAVPRLLNPDLSLQPNVFPAAAPLPALIRASGLSRLVPNRLQPTLGAHWDHSESRTIQSATGGVIAARADVWELLGGFNEAHFMYAEDLDLFWRTRALGRQARFVADAEFVHLGNASGQARWSAPARVERIARAEAAMIRGHLPAIRGTLTLVLMALGVGARVAFYRLRGDDDRSAILAGWLRGYGTGLRPRRSRGPSAPSEHV
jgi:GT2 family glycosyltransferase